VPKPDHSRDAGSRPARTLPLTPLDVRQSLVAFNATSHSVFSRRRTASSCSNVPAAPEHQDVGSIPIGQRPGGTIHLGDVAQIRVGTQDAQAHTTPTVSRPSPSPATESGGQRPAHDRDVAGLLPELERSYPESSFRFLTARAS